MTADELMAHGEWLRRVARALVGEAHADDVVQETYEVALRQPPKEEGALRPWLAGVARNLVKMRRRAAARREKREEASAVGVEAPGTEELVARAMVWRRVSEMVLALEEPGRSTLLLRYQEGLSAAEIARAQGVPAGTVRWRIKQALDQVRTRLDEEHDGDRRRWVVLVAPLAPTIAPAAPAAGKAALAAQKAAPAAGKLVLGGLAVKTGTKVIALVVVLAAMVAGTRYAGLWGKRKTTPEAAVGTGDGGASATPPAPVAAGGGGDATAASGGQAPVYRDDDPEGSLRLEGIVLDADEHGVAGARVGIDASPPRVVETDSDGSFVFDGLIARDYRVEATAGDGYAGPARLRLNDKTEPVTLRLARGGVVEVTVTERGSGAVVAGAEVELRATLTWKGTTGADGKAALTGVGPTWGSLAVTAKGFAPAAVMVGTAGNPAMPTEVSVMVEKGAAVVGRVVDEKRKPVAGARVNAVPVTEPFPVIDPRRDGVMTGGDGTFALPAIAAGTYRLTATHATFATSSTTPFVVDGATPRKGFELVMAAGGEVKGVVVDGAGQPVASAEVQVIARGHVDWRPRRQAFTDRDGRFAIAGLPRRSVEIVAWHATGASAIVPADLAVERAHEVKLVLDVTGAITGTVVDPQGEPVGDAQVVADPVARGSVEGRTEWQVRGVQEAVTDAGGGFRFAGLPAGSYRVRAARPSAPERALWQGDGVSAKPGDPPLRLVLTADGGVTGKVALPDGKAPALFTVSVGSGHAVPVASDDGSFRAQAAAGKVSVRIAGPGFVSKRVEATVVAGDIADLGTIEVEAGRSVSGRVLDPAGVAVAGAQVAAGALLSGDGTQLYIESESINARSTETDEEGRYVMSGFGPVPLVVVAGKDGSGRSLSVPVARGPDSVVVDLALQAVGQVDGTITRQGQPLADTIVIANPIGAVSSNFFVTTGPDGTFGFDALTGGEYFLYPMIGGGGQRPKDMVMRVLTVTPGKRASITVDATPGSSTLTVEAATDAGGPVPIALVVVMQATVDAPNMESLRDGSFLPPEMRAGATLTMHSRMAMGGQIELDEMRAGRFTACVVPLPATDPMSARALMEDADRLPMKCTPVTTGASPAKARVVVPVGWTTPKAP